VKVHVVVLLSDAMVAILRTFLLFVSFNCVSFLHCYNILFVVPGIGDSHVMFDTKLANLLAGNNRNNVTLIVLEMNQHLRPIKLLPNIRLVWIDDKESAKKFDQLSGTSQNIFENEESKCGLIYQF